MAGESVVINSQSYYELGDAFNANGTMNDGIYFVGPEVAQNPSDSLKTILYSKVAFPGTFDGIGTVELSYDEHPLKVCLAIIGSPSTVASYKTTLSSNLIRADGARYTVELRCCPSTPGCKVAGKPIVFPNIPIGVQGKELVQVLVFFEQLSDAN